jgi:hypothetical protein
MEITNQNYEEYYFLVCDALSFCRSSTTFRGNFLPPFSGRRANQTRSKQIMLAEESRLNVRVLSREFGSKKRK